MIKAIITHDDGERKLYLHGEDMETVIAKIYEWQDWLDNLQTIKMMKGYKKNPEKFISSERESGWYTKAG